MIQTGRYISSSRSNTPIFGVRARKLLIATNASGLFTVRVIRAVNNEGDIAAIAAFVCTHHCIRLIHCIREYPKPVPLMDLAASLFHVHTGCFKEIPPGTVCQATSPVLPGEQFHQKYHRSEYEFNLVSFPLAPQNVERQIPLHHIAPAQSTHIFPAPSRTEFLHTR